MKGDLILLKYVKCHGRLCIFSSLRSSPKGILRIIFQNLDYGGWAPEPAIENKLGSFRHQGPKTKKQLLPNYLHNSHLERVLDAQARGMDCASVPGTIPILTMKVLYPRKALSPRQTWTLGPPQLKPRRCNKSQGVWIQRPCLLGRCKYACKH